VDTVEPWDAKSGRGTGFRFDTPDGTGLMWAIDEAREAFRDAKGWKKLMRNGMSRDFSWDRSARSYVDLYRRAMGRA
jgi:starch synthase